MGSSQYDNIVSDYNYLYDDLQSLPYGQLEEANLHATVAPHIVSKRVLDLGCGSGHYTRRVLERGAESVVGVDLSEGMVEDAAPGLWRRREDDWSLLLVMSHMVSI